MTYNVFSGTLNPTQSVSHNKTHCSDVDTRQLMTWQFHSVSSHTSHREASCIRHTQVVCQTSSCKLAVSWEKTRLSIQGQV